MCGSLGPEPFKNKRKSHPSLCPHVCSFQQSLLFLTLKFPVNTLSLAWATLSLCLRKIIAGLAEDIQLMRRNDAWASPTGIRKNKHNKFVCHMWWGALKHRWSLLQENNYLENYKGRIREQIPCPCVSLSHVYSVSTRYNGILSVMCSLFSTTHWYKHLTLKIKGSCL